MIKLLCKHLTPTTEDDKVELVQVAAMREIRSLLLLPFVLCLLMYKYSAQLLELGEGGLSMGESLAAAIVSQLSDRSPAVRLTAASCVRALSTALPKCIFVTTLSSPFTSISRSHCVEWR